MSVVKTPAEAGTTFDFVVCAHKAIKQELVPEQLVPAVDEKKSTLVIIQNGVGNEEPFRNRFPRATILSCVVCPPYGFSRSILNLLTGKVDLGRIQTVRAWCDQSHQV